MRVTFLKSAVLETDFPPADIPEIGIVGRSNAGKSSFINALAGGKKVAKVSSAPGKTRLLNFFDCGKAYRLVDMPGYGYAARAGNEVNQWKAMVENYLALRTNLAGLILIMDIRRKWQPEEQILLNWCQQSGVPLAVVLNKLDKVKQGERVKKKREIAAVPGVDLVFLLSAQTGQGMEFLEDDLYNRWIKPIEVENE